MFALNLLFDLSKRDGLFSGDCTTGGTGIPAELRKSLNWLKWKGPPPPDPPDMPNPPGTSPPFDPEASNSWKDLRQAGALLLSKNKQPGWICIRAMPDPRGPAPAAGATLQLVVSFGRPARFYQPQASPFTHDGQESGNIITTFVKGPAQMNTSRGWWFPLGQIAIPQTEEHLAHRYEFSVGLIVKSGAQEFHYGEDPEMDIEM